MILSFFFVAVVPNLNLKEAMYFYTSTGSSWTGECGFLSFSFIFLYFLSNQPTIMVSFATLIISIFFSPFWYKFVLRYDFFF